MVKENILLQVTNSQFPYTLEKEFFKRNQLSIMNHYFLNDISLTLYKGEILTLIGESGSGKTTLAKAILGMVPNAEIKGSIYFQGERFNGFRNERNEIKNDGLIFQLSFKIRSRR